TSMKERPSSQISAPIPENSLLVASGGYMNQPVLGAELKKIDPQTKMPPSRKLQKPKAERRGNGSSRAPSIDGSRKIAMASKIGTAKRNIITVPCSVKAWLKKSALRRSLFGTASCRRTSSARTPANNMKAKAVTPYQSPIWLLLTEVQ